MSRPRIGITIDTSEQPNQYESPMAYSTAVEKAGGLPLLIPYRTDLSLIGEIADCFDGFLFSGGNDLNPDLYDGGAYHPKAEPVDPLRQQFELALMAEVEKRRRPLLGICLGSQVLNVYRGGSLNQFLPDLPRDPMIEHRKLKGETLAPRHGVKMEADSIIARAIGKTSVDANSSHKQSVNRVGKGLRIVAKSPDGVVEGIEDPSFPLFVGVQWHPERLHDEADHLALFKLLIDRSQTAD